MVLTWGHDAQGKILLQELEIETLYFGSHSLLALVKINVEMELLCAAGPSTGCALF